jgi:hypothetical protein
MTNYNSRFRFALSWALQHFAISLAVVAASAALVFGLWYPSPWRQMLGIAGIFGLVVVVDAVCGPLLTFVLASPKKSSRERWVDLSLVALIQVAALGYGIWAVFSARPVILAFEVDRLVLVTANEVQTEQLIQAPEGIQKLPLAGVRSVAVRKAGSQEEYLASLEQSLQGVSQAMRPSWWRSAEAFRTEVDQHAKPLSELLSRRPRDRQALEDAAAKTGLSISVLRFLPLTSSKGLDWTALINESGEVVGFASVEAFE